MTDDRRDALIEAVLTIGGDLDLPSTLRRIVQAACEMVDATYGALGVIGEAGSDRQLVEFVYEGMPEDVIEEIGRLPEGHGILGLLIDEPQPLRLRDLTRHAAAYGFPEGHPPMRSFLGTPIRVGDRVFGNLYLTEKRGAEEFSERDQELVVALASVAGVAIEHARLYEDARRRERWRETVLEVATTLLSGAGSSEVLPTIAIGARELVSADLVTLVVPIDDERLSIEVAEGPHGEDLRGRVYERRGSLAGEAMDQRGGVRVEQIPGDDPLSQPVGAIGIYGPAIAVPLAGGDRTIGALLVARRLRATPFGVQEQELLVQYAEQAAIAVAFGRVRDELQRLSLLEDRERIGRDLHDTVIQRLFATGLTLQAAGRRASGTEPELAQRIDDAVEELDDVIRQIRTTIFALQSGPGAGGLRADILELVRSLRPMLGVTPAVRLDGPIDTVVAPVVGEHVVPVLREALTNVAKHARATRIDVAVLADTDEGMLTIEVRDDGVGVPAGDVEGGFGLRNLRSRAQAAGGSFDIVPAPQGGTLMRWQVPLPA